MWEEITICGSEGLAFIRGGKLSFVRQGSNERLEPEDLPPASNPDRNFVDAILGKDEVQSPPVCGLRVIELTEAAWESGRTGRPVKVKRA